MAKAKTEVSPQVATPAVTSGPTPENTPVPGGGSWRWSDTPPHWVANLPDQLDHPSQPAPTTAPLQE